MKPKYTATSALNWPAGSSVQSDPLGVVLIMGAWNYPMQLTFAPVGRRASACPPEAARAPLMPPPCHRCPNGCAHDSPCRLPLLPHHPTPPPSHLPALSWSAPSPAATAS